MPPPPPNPPSAHRAFFLFILNACETLAGSVRSPNSRNSLGPPAARAVFAVLRFHPNAAGGLCEHGGHPIAVAAAVGRVYRISHAHTQPYSVTATPPTAVAPPQPRVYTFPWAAGSQRQRQQQQRRQRRHVHLFLRRPSPRKNTRPTLFVFVFCAAATPASGGR